MNHPDKCYLECQYCPACPVEIKPFPPEFVKLSGQQTGPMGQEAVWVQRRRHHYLLESSYLVLHCAGLVSCSAPFALSGFTEPKQLTKKTLFKKNDKMPELVGEDFHLHLADAYLGTACVQIGVTFY